MQPDFAFAVGTLDPGQFDFQGGFGPKVIQAMCRVDRERSD